GRRRRRDDGGEAEAGAVHLPDRCRAVRRVGGIGGVVVLPQYVGFAVAVEVAGGDDVPGRRRRRDDRFGGRRGAVHQPDRRGAVRRVGGVAGVVVLPHYVGFAVAVEIAGGDRVPARRRRRDQCLRGGRRAVHQPDRRRAVQ